MKPLIHSLIIATLACLFVSPGLATVIYDNGYDVSGTASFSNTAWPISNTFGCVSLTGGCKIANSFSLSSPATITGVDFVVFMEGSSDTLTSVDYYIRDNSGADGLSGAVLQSGTVRPTGNYWGAAEAGWPVYAESFNLASPLGLAAGEYWLQLSGAVSNDSIPYVAWYSNGSQASSAFTNGDIAGVIPSESFELNGFEGVSGTPEPGTVTLLLGGMLGLAALRRRRGLRQ